MLRALARDSVVYGIGGLLGKGLTLLLLPLYTRLFTPSEFGVIEMLTVVIALFDAILAFGMDSAQSYYFFREQPRGQAAQAQVVTAILQFRLLWGTAAFIALAALARWLTTPTFDRQLGFAWVAIALLASLIGQVASQSAEIFRLLRRPWRFVTLTIAASAFAAAVTILLVLGPKLGVRSYLFGIVAGSSIAAAAGWYGARNFLTWKRWHSEWWRPLIKFGAPLLPTGVIIYVLYNLDRWLITYYLGNSALGIYAVGSKCALLVAGVVSAFRLAWWPLAMTSLDTPSGLLFIKRVCALYVTVATAGLVLLALLSPTLVKILAAPEYHAAYPVISLLAWGSVAYGFLLVGTLGIWKKERTSWNLPLMAGAVIINTVLGFLLVPRIGIVGAGIATSASLLVASVAGLLISERLWKVGHHLGLLATQVLAGVTATALILTGYSRDVGLLQITIVALLALAVIVAIAGRNGVVAPKQVLLRVTPTALAAQASDSEGPSDGS